MKKKWIWLLLLSSCTLLQSPSTVRTEDRTEQPNSNQDQVEQRRYTARLKVNTDGTENAAGGSLVAKDNKLSGGEGTIVELIPRANPGYRFVGYTSFREDNGMSTDGLMPIENNRFELSEKIGDVTVYAHFETIKMDENTYFSDDFSVWNPDIYTIEGQSRALRVENSHLVLSPSERITLIPNVGKEIPVSETVGYQINLGLQQLAPIKPWNTMRIIFCQQPDGSYYALEVNGKKAYVKKLASLDAGIQSGEILGEAVQFELGGESHRFEMTVTGNKVSVMDNASPLLSYTGEGDFEASRLFVAFQMVSTGRIISLDSFTITKHQQKKKLRILSRIDGVEDSLATAGIVSALNNEVSSGDTLVIDVTEKYGYRFLSPGDRILLKAGSVYNGLEAALTFKGSGTQEQPIYVGMYGEGAKPVLNGEGKVEDLVSLFNQEYITIENLELTNLSPEFSTSFRLNGNNNKSKALRAINVSAKNFGVVHNITLRNLYIHDINGKLNLKNGMVVFSLMSKQI